MEKILQEGNDTIYFYKGSDDQVRIRLNKYDKKVDLGLIKSISENVSANLRINDRIFSGLLNYKNDEQNLKVGLWSDGRYELVYRNEKFDNLELIFKNGIAEIKHGYIPKTGIKINKNGYNLSFEVDKQGNITGYLESKKLKNCNLKLEFLKSKLKGTISLKKGKYAGEINLSTNGTYSGDLKIGDDDKNIRVSFFKGKTVTKAFSGFNIKF